MTGEKSVKSTSVMASGNVRIWEAFIDEDPREVFEYQADKSIDDVLRIPKLAFIPTERVYILVCIEDFNESSSAFRVSQQFPTYVDSCQEISCFFLFV